MSHIQAYKIYGYDISLYCKITEYGINTANYLCAMSFGSGNKKFCLTAIYKASNPFEIYIDRVEKYDLCITDNKLTDIENGLVKLVKLSLFFIKMIYPHVTRLTFFDDSQIYCNENKFDKLSLAYDYIIKYNQTWYENKFKAELPGLISAKDKTATNDSLMYKYFESLKELDKPLIPFEIVVNTINILQKYENEYNSSKTPREFINSLRIKYENEYCKEICKWLNSYMKVLQIKICPESWYILTSNIDDIPKFKVSKLSENNIGRIFGGKRKYTLKKSMYNLKRGTFTESYIEDFTL
jgi:hypothetical protein